jgi:hypothetical protein
MVRSVSTCHKRRINYLHVVLEPVSSTLEAQSALRTEITKATMHGVLRDLHVPIDAQHINHLLDHKKGESVLRP